MNTIRLQSLDNHDHAFAEYLYARDWSTTRQDGAMQQFYDSNGKLIAIATYDNAQASYTVEGVRA
jgi:hypothetical protein